MLFACGIFRVVFSCCIKLSLYIFFFSVISKLALPVLCSCCIRVLKKQQTKKRKKWCVIFLCCTFQCVTFFCYIIPMWNTLWYFVLLFFACGTWSGILYYIFWCVERTLVCCNIFFRVWNTHWYFLLYFSACRTRSGIYYYIFCMCGTCTGIFYYTFLRVELALIFCVIFFPMCNALWYFVLYFSTYGTRSFFSLIFSILLVWKYIWFIQTFKRKKKNPSCIFPVEFFRVVFFRVVLFVLYFLCYIFCIVLSVLYFSVIYFLCCIFRVIFSVLY